MMPSTDASPSRLKSKKTLASLFVSGEHFRAGALRVRCMVAQGPSANTQFAFAVPSKQFPRAVDRNRIKRLLRESLRQHFRSENCSTADVFSRPVNLVFIYSANRLPEIRTLQADMAELISQIRLYAEKDSPTA